MRPESIDRLLPPMACDEGCGECCGPVLCSEPEYARVVGYAAEQGIEPVDNGLTCPWLQGGTCSVYPARPTACRLFGHVEGMKCSRGYSAPISVTVERRVVRSMMDENRVAGSRLLHEALGSIDHLPDLLRAELAAAPEV